MAFVSKNNYTITFGLKNGMNSIVSNGIRNSYVVKLTSLIQHCSAGWGTNPYPVAGIAKQYSNLICRKSRRVGYIKNVYVVSIKEIESATGSYPQKSTMVCDDRFYIVIAESMRSVELLKGNSR